MGDLLSKSEASALLLLAKNVYMTCAHLGDNLWHTGGRANCSCPFARPAGAVIKKLRARGFVERHRIHGDPRTLYRLTRAGDQHIRTNRATRVSVGLEPPHAE